MIDFNAVRLPVSVQSWTAFFDAVLAADPADEDYWVEFKAALDPASKAGSATLAKALVGFANRDPERAGERFGGHGLILLGLEPGNLCGAPDIDPAPLGQSVDRYIAAPAPDWTAVAHAYRGKRVVVVRVAPPKIGDPIHCIGKSTGSLTDGTVYVRHSGRTEPATSAEIARLAARLLGASKQPSSRPIQVDAAFRVDGGLRRCAWPSSWVDRWIEEERQRLIVPLDLELAPPPDLFGSQWGTAAAAFSLKAVDAYDPLRVEERRDPDKYRAAVETYLQSCREQFSNVEQTAAARVLQPIRVSVSNPTATNYKGLRLQIALSGGQGAGSVDYFRLAKLRPPGPRVWGPYQKSIDHISGFGKEWDHEQGESWLVPRSVELKATLDFSPVDLRPEEQDLLLDESYVVLVEDGLNEVQVEWRATATNVDGVARGSISLPVAPDPLDIGEMLEHSEEPRAMVVGGGRGWSDGWDFG